MGCRGSKQQQKEDSVLPPEAAEFMKLVNDGQHPVARKTLEEWSIFVDAHTRRQQQDDTGMKALETRGSEVWATTEGHGVTHQSVDEVGKLFLQYLKNDLTLRGWAGEFDYTVAGVATQGYLRIAAKIDMGPRDAQNPHSEVEEYPWEIRIHYHSAQE